MSRNTGIQSAVQTSKLHVLLVEDNRGDERLVREMLKSAQDVEICLSHADSVTQAEETVPALQPEIILLDLCLPDDQGIETFRHMRKSAPEVPIVVLTGTDDQALGLEAVQEGAQDYLVKGEINAKSLLHAVLYAAERKKVAEAHRAFDISMRDIISNNVDGSIVMDCKGNVLFANPAAEVLFNKAADELIGQPFGFPVNGTEPVELEIVRREGGTPVVEMRSVHMEWMGQKVVLASLRDITERKKMADDLKRANRNLKKAVAELKKSNNTILSQQKAVIEEERLKLLLQVAGATAHELNQPLSVLLQSIELIQENMQNPEQVQEFVELAEASGKKLRGLVKNIQKVPSYEINPLEEDTCIADCNFAITVLSVEDRPEDYEKIKFLLRNNVKIKLLHVESIEKGLQVINRSEVDIVLLDHVLPDGDSLDFLKLLREDELEVPVVVVTGQGNEMVASKIIQAGAFDYLPKERLNKKSLSRCILNALEKYRLNQELKRAMQQMASMAARDGLTGLYNKRYFIEALEREVARACRYKSELSLCMIDFDDFKKVNDTYGHPTGDNLLFDFSRLLSENFRQSDLVCRYGGEEFAVIIPNTNSENARKVCERFRKRVNKKVFTCISEDFRATVSIGIASLSIDNPSTFYALIAMSDRALYQAKTTGKNKVVVQPGTESK